MASIAQVVPSFRTSFGGPVTSSRTVTHALIEIGHKVTVFGTGTPASHWPGAVPTGSFRIPGPPASVATISLQLDRQLRSGLRERRFDAAHIHLNRGLVSLPAALLAKHYRIPLVLQTHGMCAPWSGPKALVDRHITRKVIAAADRVLVLSKSEHDELSAWARPNSIHILENGLIRPGGNDSRRKPGRLTILFCARLHPRKGLSDFVEAAAIVQNRKPEARAIVIGPDEGAEADARKRATLLGARIEWRGLEGPAQIEQAMASASFLVHPAPREPFGMSMVEALSKGLPVLTAASAALASSIANADAGKAIEGGAAGYADAVVEISERSAVWECMSRNATLLYNSRFGLGALTKNLGAIYAGLV